MQTIQNILKISPSGAVLSDRYGSSSGVSLEITLGTATALEFDLREDLIGDDNSLQSYPLEKLRSGAYYCAFDTACNFSDSPLLLQISGTALFSSSGRTVFAVEIPDTAVEKMVSALAGKASTEMFCEIGGINSDGKANFAWHFPVTVSNRVFSGSGSSSVAGDPAYYTAVQVEAVVSRPLIYEYSIDGSSWHFDFDDEDKFFRVRHGENGTPSAAVPLFRGPKGDKGDPGEPGSGGTLTDVVLDHWFDEENHEYYLDIIPESGKRYLYSSPDGTFTCVSLSDSAVFAGGGECQIWLDGSGGGNWSLHIPQSYGIAGNRQLETGKSYILKIQYNVVHIIEYTPGKTSI